MHLRATWRRRATRDIAEITGGTRDGSETLELVGGIGDAVSATS